MGLPWSSWLELTPDIVEQLGPRSPGLFEIKVERRLIDYPAGRSAMVHYGFTDPDTPSIRAAIFNDWLVPEAEDARKAWEEYGPLVWRFALTQDIETEHKRRLDRFIERFGRSPWANPG